MSPAERAGLRLKGNVPTLRFPEFKDDWNDYRLRDLCTFHSGGTPSIDNVEYWEGEIPFVSAVAMHNTHIEKTPLTLTEKGLRNGSKQLEAGNLLLLVRGSMLWNKIPICYNDVDVAFNQDVKGIVPNSKTTSLFLLNWIQSHENRIKYMVTGTGIGAGKLDSEDLLALNVKLPSLNEQKKIEKFLSLIDERIETQIRIINEIQSLISGITQKISKHSSIRMTMLSELLVERNEKNTALFPVHSVSVSEGVINQIDYLGRSFAAADTSHYNVAHKGDIIYTKSPTGEFPFGIVKRNAIELNVAVSPLYGVYKPVTDDVAIYLHYYFCSPLNAQNYLHKLIQKGAKNTINITNQRFLENLIPLPDKKILASFVKLARVVSAKLKTEKYLLESLQSQKKYLLNSMFI